MFLIAAALVLLFRNHAFAAVFENFDDPGLRPNILNDDTMKVKMEIDFGIPLNRADLHPQKFYFVPDNPPRAEPRMVVLQSSGEARLYEKLESDPNDFKEFMNIREDVFYNGFHSIAFDPQWPASPFIYVFYIGYAKIPTDQMGRYPNKKLGGQRPFDFNIWGGRGGCYLLPDKKNYNDILNTCPQYKTSTEGCSSLSYYCEMFSRIDRIKLNVATFDIEDRKPIYGSPRSCGGYWGHVWSNIMFTSDGSMVFGMGDHAIDSRPVDPGSEYGGDMCYNSDAGPPQGMWNTQRDYSDIGKFLRVFPGRYRTANSEMSFGTDYEIIGKGARNPYSTFMTKDDYVWSGDVGNAEAERIYRFSAKGASKAPVVNFGWPCIEGEKEGPLVGSYSEGERVKYLKNNGFTICDPIYKATGVADSNYAGNPATTAKDQNYVSPNFEFREVIDTSYQGCRGTRASVSGIYFYDRMELGLKYANKLFFADHEKRCLFYATVGPDNKLTEVRALMELGDVGISHIAVHPVDGRLLVMDYQHSRIISLLGGSNGGGELPSLPPMTEIESPPAGTAPVANFQPDCTAESSTDQLGTLNWNDSGNGYMEATLTLGAVQFTNKHGTTRTRGFNGMIPGPIIRMEACKVYKLTLKNNLQNWPNERSGIINTYHDPLTTNLHTHGLHISGVGDADDVEREILAGESGVFTYAIPCDHAGGTHFYHPHHHGGVALSAGAGAVGLLIVEDNPFYESPESRPSIYNTYPTHHLVFQLMSPAASNAIAFVAKDDVHQSLATGDYYLTNGCTDYSFVVEFGKWTRLRMLHVGRQHNAVISIRDGAGNVACKSAMIAKDGVYSSPAGRAIQSKYFFTPSGRADVAIYCSNAGTYILEVESSTFEGRVKLGTFTVAPGIAKDQNTMPEWLPCRPYYLQDLVGSGVGTSTSIFLSEGMINDRLWSGTDADILSTMTEGSAQGWSISGSDLHMFHIHINHVQIQDSYNWGNVPDWYQKGDWLDTISVPTTANVRFRADRFGGKMIFHCHIYEHSDTGMMAKANILGGQREFDYDISIKDPVGCSTVPECPTVPDASMPWCPPSVDDNNDPTCKNGILHPDGITCCDAQCESCGGITCGSSTGGAANCCASTISKNGRFCSEYKAPCTLSDDTEPTPPTPPPVSGGNDPTCAKGKLHPDQKSCCDANCQFCGGVNCGSSTGGAANCCASAISTNGRSCDLFNAPCTVQGGVTATKPPSPPTGGADPTCANGIMHPNGVACCAATCEDCGGVNCSTSTGGAASCCNSGISVSGRSCSLFPAPCNIGGTAPPPTTTPPPGGAGADPTCAFGIRHPNGIACCAATCEDCGGVNCSSSTGGAASCCNSGISVNGRSCDAVGAPCNIGGGGGGGGGFGDPNCRNGIIHSNGVTCCAATCEDCGGVTCGASTGGAASCCASGISGNGRSCDTSVAPCTMNARRKMVAEVGGGGNLAFEEGF